jgi:uncharacterized protein
VAVHVSIHDVSPRFAADVDVALELCAARGIRPALLVVPNFHEAAPLLDDPGFCARLRDLQARGHEVFLHGFFHLSPGGPRTLRSFFRQRIVSANEAEFSAVTEDEARARLDRGARVLDAAGLRSDGFIAPAWSMPRWLVPELARRGVHFTEDHTRIYDPAGGRSRASVVLNWASRSPARLASTVVYCRLAKGARALVPARVAIHPGDMRSSLLRHEVARMLDWARGDVVARAEELFA